MKTVALMLGAGASKAFGLPLTNEIFPRMWSKLLKQKILRREQRMSLLKLVKAMYPGLKEEKGANLFMPNITDVLSLVDHLIINNNAPFGMFSVSEMIACRRYLEIAIVKVIEEDFYDYDPDSELDQLYDLFIEWIYENRNKRQFNIISTNYDITVEFGLKSYYKYDDFANKVDFGFSWRDPINGKIHTPPAKPLFGIYKVHGSTNWLKCDLCNQVYIHIEGNIFHNTLTEQINDNNTCHCGHGRLSSIIVSPSLERDVRDANLNYVWSRAVEKFRTAHEWIIIGYSLPSEDLNIRSIMTRALHARRTKPKITVVQMNRDDNDYKYHKARFEAQFGKITYHRDGLEKYLEEVH
jgi:hypothetical protein